PASGRWLIVTGPNLPEETFRNLSACKPPHVEIERFRRDFPSLLRGARLSVSQAGYNTVCDVLRAGCRAVLVPFTTGGETEQATRAERLERLGLAAVLPEETMTGAGMAEAVAAMLSAGPVPSSGLDLDGAAKTAEILAAMWRRSA
ncbi:glycosyl transferase, partial [Rhizobium sp. TRM95111]|uniref:glycosyltransferase n=1 Tax=Rhizobium alarense TaxID=2846851 RepID=UPI0022A8BC2E